MADVKNWNKWHTGIAYSYLNGDFAQDTWGSFKATDRLQTLYMLFQISKCIKNQTFAMKVKRALCTIEIGYELHELSDEENKQKIKLYIKISGLLTFIHKKKIGRIFLVSVQKSMKNLVTLAKIMEQEL
ncbi:MAG: hypothetical protein FWD91_01885 [Treponema sp.]|nr:hypothetical protein [Treponema sp.]